MATFSNDIELSRAARTTIYASSTNQGVQLKSNGSGVLQLNADGGGNVTIAENGGLVSTADLKVDGSFNSNGNATMYINGAAAADPSWIYWQQGSNLRWLSGLEGNSTDFWFLSYGGNGNGIPRLILKESGYVGIGNTFPIGTNTKLGVSFNVGGSAANLGESVNYSTFSLYPYRVGSDHGMFFGNQGYTAGYIQSAHGATPGASTGTLSLNPFGGNVGVGNGTSAPSTKLSVNGANYVEMATFAAATGATAGIISTNAGYITSYTARHNTNTAVFYPVSSGNSSSSGIRFEKSGIVHITATQDFISSGTTGYAAVYIQKNGSNIAESLRPNSNGVWNMFNSTVTTTVAVNDIISFSFSANNFTSMDVGSWSQYSFMWTSR